MDKKRKAEDKKLEKYKNKIRKIEERRKRSKYEKTPPTPTPSAILNQELDISEEHEVLVSSEEEHQDNLTSKTVNEFPPNVEEPGTITVALSAEILDALGDPLPEQSKFGPKICENVARILNTILKGGLKKEAKDSLMKELVPENCSMLIAPKMNIDVIAVIGEKIHNRDKKIEHEQNQLGLGLAIISNILATLTTEEVDRLKLINVLSNAVRVLADLHAMQTRTRKNLVMPLLDKPFYNLVKDVERDEFLFGSNLQQQIAAMNNSKKNAKTIKKPSQNQGNYNGPSRYHQTGSQAVMRYGARRPPLRNYQNQTQNQPKFPKRRYPEPVKGKNHVPTPK